MHASCAKKRVVITSLDKPFYKRRYLGARRYYNFNTPFLRPSSFSNTMFQRLKKQGKVLNQFQRNLTQLRLGFQKGRYLLLEPKNKANYWKGIKVGQGWRVGRLLKEG